MRVKETMKTISIFLIPLIIAAVFWGVFAFTQRERKIENGFSAELTAMLEEQYEIYVPQSAEFIGGYYESPSAKDRSLYIVFSVPAEEVENVFSQNWNEYSGKSGGMRAYQKFADFDEAGIKTYDMHTTCSYSAKNADGKIICGVSLLYPRDTIV